MNWNDRFIDIIEQWGAIYSVSAPPVEMSWNNRVIWWLEGIRDAMTP